MNCAAHLHVEQESGRCREIPVTRDHRSLADVLATRGLQLNTRRGRRGLCRGCEVLLREGSLMTDSGAINAPATVQACRTRLAGAQLALVDRTTPGEMENLRVQVEVIKLNLAADFENRCIGHLSQP